MIGQRLRAVRQAFGVSLEDLGDLAGVNWTTIGKIERGVSSPTVETLIRLTSALEVDPGAIISGVSVADYGDRESRVTVRELTEAREAQVAARQQAP